MIHATFLILALQVGPIGPVISATPANTLGSYGRGYDVAYIDGVDRFFSVYTRYSTSDPAGPVPPYWFGRIHGVVTPMSTSTPDAPIDLDSMAVETTSPCVAWNPSTRRLLVAFVGDPDTGGGAHASDIYAIVLDENGVLVGPAAPFRLSSDEVAGDWSTAPRIACDGNEWFVVWKNYSSNLAQTRLRGCFVKGSSTTAAPVLGSAGGAPAGPITLVSGNDDLDLPVVAWAGGSGYLVAAFQRWRYLSDTAIRGCTVERDGTAGALKDFVLNGATIKAGVPGLAGCPATGEYLLAWSSFDGSDGDPCVLRLDAAGNPVGPALDLDPDLGGDAVEGSVTPLWNAAAQQALVAWYKAPPNSRNSAGVVTTMMGARLNPDGTILQSPLSLGLDSGNQSWPYIAAAARGTGMQVIVEGARFPAAGRTLGQRQVELGANPNAPADPAPAQHRSDDAGVITPGMLAPQYGFIAKAAVTVTGAATARLQVEVRPVGSAFTGSPTAVSAPTPTGSTAAVAVPLAPGGQYRWQARFAASNGFSSAWVSFGDASLTGVDLYTNANTVPTLSGLQQRRADGTAIPVGQAVEAGGAVTLRALAYDPDGDPMRLEVEVKPVGRDFDGESTEAVAATNAGSAAVPLDLPQGGAFHWRARVTGPLLGDASPWSSFGGNPDGEADFKLMALGSSDVTSACQASSAGGAPLVGLQLAALLLGLGAARRITR